MKKIEELGSYIESVDYKDLSPSTVESLKIRVLDSLGCAIGALKSEVVKKVKNQIDDFGGAPLSTLIGSASTAPDRAALYNGALIRFLDFNDSFLAKNETCHPSDNIAAVLAAAEYALASGKEFLTALAIAYQVHTQLSESAPVRQKGFDHTTQGIYAAAAGASKALRLNKEKTSNALAIAGVSSNALRVTRTGRLSNWKGLAYPYAGFSAINAVFLAYRGVTGPLEIFEGNKGFMESIAGPFEISWNKAGLSMVENTILKKYNAEIHSQTTIEALLEMKKTYRLSPENIERVDIEIFDVAWNIIGGGEEGEKKQIRTKEEADHSLPYMSAAALLDGEVMPGQYTESRIESPDIQTLLQKIYVRPSVGLSARFPKEMAVKITVSTKEGKTLVIEKSDYEGFYTRPLNWEGASKKFHSLARPMIGQKAADEIAALVWQLPDIDILDLGASLASLKIMES